MRNFILSPNFKNSVKVSFLSLVILIASLNFGCCLNASAMFDDEFPPFEANSQNNEEADASETNNSHRPLSINPTGHFESEFNMDAEKLLDDHDIVLYASNPDYTHQLQRYSVRSDIENSDKCIFLDVDTTVEPMRYLRGFEPVVNPNSENAKELSSDEYKKKQKEYNIKAESLKFVMFPDHK